MAGSLTSNQIKFIRSLSQKKARQESGLFVVEGEKLVEEAVKSGFKIKEIYRRDEIGYNTMERISSLASPPPLLAVVEQPPMAEYATPEWIAKFSSGKDPLILVLERVKDPGNLGTIIRAAEWFGVDVIYLSEESVELYNPKVVQATMGAIFREKISKVTSITELLESFRAHSLPIYATSLKGENLYTTSSPLTKGVIVMGNESEGISEQVSKIADKLLLIPSFTNGEGSESLNVATATAVICAEFRRQASVLQPQREL